MSDLYATYTDARDRAADLAGTIAVYAIENKDIPEHLKARYRDALVIVERSYNDWFVTRNDRASKKPVTA